MIKKFFSLFPVLIALLLNPDGLYAQSHTSGAVPLQHQPVFTENTGQVHSLEHNNAVENVLFKVAAPSGDLYVTTAGLSYVFFKQKAAGKKQPPRFDTRDLFIKATRQKQAEKLHYEVERVDITLLRADIKKEHAEIIYSAGDARVNYYTKSPAGTHLHTIARVIIHNIFPGIDWVLFTGQQNDSAMLKQDFILHPGADTRLLVFSYSKNAGVVVNAAGGISVAGQLGKIAEAPPSVYEYESKKRIDISVIKKGRTVSYRFPETFIKTKTIIDPDLFWGTALTSDVPGIDYNDQVTGDDVETDNAGNIFVLLSVTKGVSFPSVNPGGGAYYEDFAAAPDGAVNILKFSKSGVLLWSTFFGDGTTGIAMAADPSGNLYAAGNQLTGGSVPLLDNGGYFDNTSKYNFIAKFSPAGQLLSSTYFGDFEMLMSRLACDSKGNLYVNGVSYPQTFPARDPGNGAYRFGGAGAYAQGPFISEFLASGQLSWSTQINGMAYYNSPQRMAIDASDNLYLLNDSVRMFTVNHQEVFSDATVGWPYLQDIAVDRQGEIFVVGFGPAAIPKTDPGNGAFIDNTPNPGISTGFIIKYGTGHQVAWSTSFFNQAMTDLYRVTADKKCDAIHLTGVMNSQPYAVPTVGNSCNAGFYFSNQQAVTTYAPVFVSFKTSGRLIYTSLSDFPYNYYDQGLSVTSDPFGNLIYLFGQIFHNSDLPAVKDPGNGAFVQSGDNNVSLSAFLLKLTPSRMNAAIGITPPSGCNCNGSAAINITCGTAPYLYAWSNGATTSSVSGLCSGNYSVTVTDDNCNDSTFTFAMPPAPGSITGFSATPATAHCNQADGSVVVNSVQGGVTPYQYALDALPFQATGSFTGLTPGTYQITVRDANGCSYKDSVRLDNTGGPDSIYSGAVASFCMQHNGSVQIDSVRGGSAPFLYSINSGSFTGTNVFTNLPAGAIYLQVKDAAGCTTGDSVVIMQSVPPSSALFSMVPDHCNLKDGSVNIFSVNGGLAPYTYSVNGTAYQPGSVFSNLAAGTYPVFIMDSRNCILADSVAVPELAGPTAITLGITDALCNAVFGGVRVVQVSGGSTPYTYSLDSLHFFNTGSFDSLTAAAYDIYVRDSAGCVLGDSFHIAATVATPVKIVPSDTAVCYGTAVLLSAAPGDGPSLKTYNWNNGTGDSAVVSITVQNAQAVVLTVTNDAGCTSTGTATLVARNCDSTAADCVHFANAFSPNKDGYNDLFGALAGCAVTGYQLHVFNRYGQVVFESADVLKKWDGTFRGVLQEAGNYVYTCEYAVGSLKKVKTGSVVLVR